MGSLQDALRIGGRKARDQFNFSLRVVQQFRDAAQQFLVNSQTAFTFVTSLTRNTYAQYFSTRHIRKQTCQRYEPLGLLRLRHGHEDALEKQQGLVIERGN